MFNKFDLLLKIPERPFPQYSIFESLTDTENDILLFSIAISFSSKKFIKYKIFEDVFYYNQFL